MNPSRSPTTLAWLHPQSRAVILIRGETNPAISFTKQKELSYCEFDFNCFHLLIIV